MQDEAKSEQTMDEGTKEATTPAEPAQLTWLETWKLRLGKLLEIGKDDLVVAINKSIKDGTPPAAWDPSARIGADLHCKAVDESPMPYILNVGCGFMPTAIGWRTKQGIPVTVVGADPLAHAINEALTVMGSAHEAMGKSRRFVAPIVGEEMSALFPSGSFHAVYSDGVLLDALDPFRFLQQCVRATKSGGVVCVRLGKPSADRLWQIHEHNGGSITLRAKPGGQKIDEVRGERVEIHTMQDDTLMIKIRRTEHSADEIAKAQRKMMGGLIVGPNGR